MRIREEIKNVNLSLDYESGYDLVQVLDLESSLDPI